jgi:plasmid stability protein
MESASVPNLSIKNVPEELLNKLRERAARHHRSIQGELMALLVAALEPAAVGPESGGSADPGFRRTGTRTVKEIAAEHRKRWPKPFDQGPFATDIIRSDRDAR